MKVLNVIRVLFPVKTHVDPAAVIAGMIFGFRQNHFIAGNPRGAQFLAQHFGPFGHDPQIAVLNVLCM